MSGEEVVGGGVGRHPVLEGAPCAVRTLLEEAATVGASGVSVFKVGQS
jgi:hypothetical protein